MDIYSKYEKYRPIAKDGDILLCKNNSIIGRQISRIDKSYFTHSLVVFGKAGRLFSFDSTEIGVRSDLVSVQLNKYIDFCVLRPQRNAAEKQLALRQLFQYSEKGIKYDFKQVLKIFLYQKTGIDTFKNDNIKRDICSELTWNYTQFFPLPCYDKSIIKRPFFTPEDFIRYLDPKDINIYYG